MSGKLDATSGSQPVFPGEPTTGKPTTGKPAPAPPKSGSLPPIKTSRKAPPLPSTDETPAQESTTKTVARAKEVIKQNVEATETTAAPIRRASHQREPKTLPPIVPLKPETDYYKFLKDLGSRNFAKVAETLSQVKDIPATFQRYMAVIRPKDLFVKGQERTLLSHLIGRSISLAEKLLKSKDLSRAQVKAQGLALPGQQRSDENVKRLFKSLLAPSEPSPRSVLPPLGAHPRAGMAEQAKPPTRLPPLAIPPSPIGRRPGILTPLASPRTPPPLTPRPSPQNVAHAQESQKKAQEAIEGIAFALTAQNRNGDAKRAYAILKAVDRNLLETVLEGVRKVGNLGFQDKNEDTLLHLACKEGNVAIAQALIKYMPEKSLHLFQRDSVTSAFQLSCKHKEMDDISQSLVKSFADINRKAKEKGDDTRLRFGTLPEEAYDFLLRLPPAKLNEPGFSLLAATALHRSLGFKVEGTKDNASAQKIIDFLLKDDTSNAFKILDRLSSDKREKILQLILLTQTEASIGKQNADKIQQALIDKKIAPPKPPEGTLSEMESVTPRSSLQDIIEASRKARIEKGQQLPEAQAKLTPQQQIAREASEKVQKRGAQEPFAPIGVPQWAKDEMLAKKAELEKKVPKPTVQAPVAPPVKPPVKPPGSTAHLTKQEKSNIQSFLLGIESAVRIKGAGEGGDRNENLKIRSLAEQLRESVLEKGANPTAAKHKALRLAMLVGLHKDPQYKGALIYSLEALKDYAIERKDYEKLPEFSDEETKAQVAACIEVLNQAERRHQVSDVNDALNHLNTLAGAFVIPKELEKPEKMKEGIIEIAKQLAQALKHPPGATIDEKMKFIASASACFQMLTTLKTNAINQGLIMSLDLGAFKEVEMATSLQKLAIEVNALSGKATPLSMDVEDKLKDINKLSDALSLAITNPPGNTMATKAEFVENAGKCFQKLADLHQKIRNSKEAVKPIDPKYFERAAAQVENAGTMQKLLEEINSLTGANITISANFQNIQNDVKKLVEALLQAIKKPKAKNPIEELEFVLKLAPKMEMCLKNLDKLLKSVLNDDAFSSDAIARAEKEITTKKQTLINTLALALEEEVSDFAHIPKGSVEQQNQFIDNAIANLNKLYALLEPLEKDKTFKPGVIANMIERIQEKYRFLSS